MGVQVLLSKEELLYCLLAIDLLEDFFRDVLESLEAKHRRDNELLPFGRKNGVNKLLVLLLLWFVVFLPVAPPLIHLEDPNDLLYTVLSLSRKAFINRGAVS